MIDTRITIDSLARAISGNIVGASDFRSPGGFTGIFNILKDSSEGDIVIRHWIDEKGIKIASSKNVACIITEDPRGNSIDIATDLKIPLIVVKKIEEANAIALNWSIKNFVPNSKRIIISGTNGKSTTSHMIYHILKSTGANTLTNTDSKSEFNTLIDPMVPKIISEYALSNDGQLDYLVIEASEVQGWLGKLMHNHALLMTKAVNPDVGVVTNVAIDHIGLVNSIKEVFEETSGIAKGMSKGTLVLNHDDEYVFNMADFAESNVETFYFSMNSVIKDININTNTNTNTNTNNNTKVNDINNIGINNINIKNVDINNTKNISSNENSIEINKSLIYDTESKSIIYKSKPILTIEELPFNSNHFIQNTLAAISACLSLNIKIKDIVNGVKSYKSLKRRFRKINCNPIIIDDFAHNPEGIKATINAVANFPHQNLKIICAIRGSRGKEINEINAKAIVEALKDINSNYNTNYNHKNNNNHKNSKHENNNKYKNNNNYNNEHGKNNSETLPKIKNNEKLKDKKLKIKKSKDKNINKVEIILSSSSDVVDESNFVEDFEEETFFNVLNKENISYTHYKMLKDALYNVYNSSKVDDLILLIGAQGMDPAEELLNEIFNEDN